MSVIPVNFRKKVNSSLSQPSTLRKLLFFLEEKYEVHFEWHEFEYDSRFQLERSERILKGLLEKNQPLFFGEQLFYPIYERELMIGYIQLEGHTDFSQKRQKDLFEVLKWVFLDKGGLPEHLETLKAKEKQLFLSHMIYKKQQIFFADEHKENFQENISFFRNKKEKMFEFSVLIQAQSSEDIYKMAHEIHYFSHRYAFCHISQLQESEKLDFKGLGAVTLFIPDLTELSETQQRVLAEFLMQSYKFSDVPRIVCGLRTETKDKWVLLYPELLKNLKLVKMQDTFDSYKDQGILSFLSDYLKIHCG